VSEVKRTAAANGGAALGRLRLETETGIKEHHWRKFWARYSDVVTEAGLTPNTKPEPWTEAEICALITKLARDLGHFPVHADIRVMKNSDPGFPNHRVIDRRLGQKPEKIAKLAAWCRANPGNEDVLAMCETATVEETPEPTVCAPVQNYITEAASFCRPRAE